MRVRTVGALSLALAASAFAQDQGGAVEGVARDASGAPVTGASLVVRSGALIRPLEGQSDRAGAYRSGCSLVCARGRKDMALEWLERAFAAHDFEMAYLNVDPAWEALRSEPRFQDLLRCMEFPSRPE